MNARTNVSTPRSKADEILDGVLSGEGRITSLREAYVEITGDSDVTGKLKQCNELRMHNYLARDDGQRFTEAVSASTFGNTLAASVSRMMLNNYRSLEYLNSWRKIVQIVPVSDFRVQKRWLLGAFSNLPQVSEGNSYLSLGSMNEEGYELAVSKRGGTESITFETIKNDDVGLVRSIANELALAAAHTLVETVFNLLADNPVVADGMNLFHVGHDNYGSQALSAASMSGAFMAMRSQENVLLRRRNYIAPKFVLVPNELEETAFNALQRTVNNDRNFLQVQGIEVVPVGYWSDPARWFMSADPLKNKTIDVSFLDGNEEPELFFSETPSAGSLFSNDAVTVKIRHTYGVAVADPRAFYRNKP